MKIINKEGDPKILKNENAINIEFTYEHVAVGKFANENDYIEKKREDLNNKEPGKGDNWANNWINDRAARYEPKFINQFINSSRMTLSKDATYTMIFKTTFTEPGFNNGWVRKNALINADVWIVETADKTKRVAAFAVKDAPGRIAFGTDFGDGLRISEAYGLSGKKLGRHLK